MPGTTSLEECSRKGKAFAADPEAFDAPGRGPASPTTSRPSSTRRGRPASRRGRCSRRATSSRTSSPAAPLLPLPPTTVALSFLPLSHVLERMVEYCYFHWGATIAYAESIDKLRDNLVEVNPHVFGAVPRVYEKVHARILDMSRGSGRAAEALPSGARRSAKGARRCGQQKKTPDPSSRLQHFVLDRLVFSQDPRRARHAASGTRISGGAPLEGPRGVLLVGGHRGLRGLRPDRDEPGHRRELPGGVAPRDGRADPPGRGMQDRAGRRDPHARAEHHEGVLQQARGDDGGHRRHGWFHTGDIGGSTGRLPRDHRPEEGDHRQLQREEHRAGADRRAPERGPVTSRCRS